MTETNNFVLVTRRRKNCNKKRSFSKYAAIVVTQDCEIDHETLVRTLNNTVNELRDTLFTKSVFRRLTESLTILDSKGISEIICYGLGRFSEYRSPRYQLALLLCLKARYNARIYIYDPVFSHKEIKILHALELDIIQTNEEGKRVIKDNTTLIYMPHCSKQLTNNFLYANWGNGLSNCILFTNSFSGIIDSCLHRNILNSADYILRIQPYATEIQIENFAFEEVFNDLNIHIFAKQDLLKVPADFWNFREKPRYLIDEIEFITITKAELRRVSQNKNIKDNAMLQYIMEQAHVHKETSQILCKAREELRNLAETYLCYLRSQQTCKEIHKQYAGKGERSIQETADLVGFKLPHDPK